MDIETKLINFREYVTIHYLKQNDEIKYTYSKSKQSHFYDILLISNRLVPVEADDTMSNLIQFGIIFNGGNIVYYTEDAEELSQQKFNEVLIFNIFQFLCGMYLKNNTWTFGTAVLMAVHFGLVEGSKPKYAQSQRQNLVEKYYGRTKFEFYYPDKDIKTFFLNEMVNGKVKFPEDSRFNYTPLDDGVFGTAIGTILQLNCQVAEVTLSGGVSTCEQKLKAIFLKENGKFRATTFGRKEAEPLKDLKKVYDALMREE